MPKATLSFQLPEEEQEHADAVHGHEWRHALDDVRQAIREKLKYSELTPEAAKALEEIQTVLFDAAHDIDGDF